MSHGYRHNPRKQQYHQRNNRHASAATEVDEQHPMLKAFRGYARELDDKHDRNERIVKLSRDITIESKRIIFLLHTIDGRKQNKPKVLEEAQQRLQKVIETQFKAVAKELLNQDVYQYRWAYAPGLQEFIEAYSFYEYFKSGECESSTPTATANDLETTGLSDWEALQAKMQYTEAIPKDPSSDEKQADQEKETEESLAKTLEFKFHIDPTEYILGLSDLTGELMRRCINCLGSGETDMCMETCKALQQFYTGYISLNVQRCRELSRKIYTMRQSLLKAENVCYNVKVRGGEAAVWGAVFDKPADDVDEGFY